MFVAVSPWNYAGANALILLSQHVQQQHQLASHDVLTNVESVSALTKCFTFLPTS